MLSRHSIRGAHAAASATKKVAGEQVTKLPSGLTVASIDNYGPLSQLVLAFRAGSRYESKSEGGLVHHLRNSVGTDSTKYPGLSLVWSSGLAGGQLTSFATRDLFGVSIAVPRDQTSVALSILGHVAADPAFKPWDVEEIASIVKTDNAYKQAYNILYEDIHRAAYRNGSLAQSVFAGKHQIGKIGYKTLQNFANDHIVSSGGVLFGTNIEHERLVIYGDNHAPIKQGSSKSVAASPYKGGEYRRATGGSLAHVIVAGQGAPGADVKALATQSVLLALLGRNSSVGYSGVAGNGIISKAVGTQGSSSAFQAVHEDSGLVGMYLVADPSKIAGVVTGAVNAIKHFKVSDVEAAKVRATMDILRGNAHSDGYVIERSAQLLAGIKEGAVIEAIKTVSAADVESAAKKMASKLSVASNGPIDHVPYVDSL